MRICINCSLISGEGLYYTSMNLTIQNSKKKLTSLYICYRVFVVMKDCLFCKIAKGEVPASIVYKDKNVVAFKDINPQAPVHILVIPVKHISSLRDDEATNAELLSSIFATIQKLAVKFSLDNGFRVVSNCDVDGGQTVWHLHFHLLGRRKLSWPPG